LATGISFTSFLEHKPKVLQIRVCKSIEKTSQKCSDECKQSDCDTKYLERNILRKSKSNEGSSILFYLQAINAPMWNMFTNHRKSISALIANIGGTASLWMGIFNRTCELRIVVSPSIL